MLPIGGVVADRLGRARVIAITDVVLSAFVMPIGRPLPHGHRDLPLLASLVLHPRAS